MVQLICTRVVGPRVQISWTITTGSPQPQQRLCRWPRGTLDALGLERILPVDASDHGLLVTAVFLFSSIFDGIGHAGVMQELTVSVSAREACAHYSDTYSYR